MRADGYRWWIERLRRTFELVDLTRIDHFRGFVSYWAVPARNKTAVEGTLAARPGRASCSTRSQAALGELPVVAEDLGVITEPVVRLRTQLGLPGHGRAPVRARRRPDEPAPAARTTSEQSVVYTGTHDNDTTRGWFESLSPRASRRGRSSTRPTRRGA